MCRSEVQKLVGDRQDFRESIQILGETLIHRTVESSIRRQTDIFANCRQLDWLCKQNRHCDRDRKKLRKQCNTVSCKRRRVTVLRQGAAKTVFALSTLDIRIILFEQRSPEAHSSFPRHNVVAQRSL